MCVCVCVRACVCVCDPITSSCMLQGCMLTSMVVCLCCRLRVQSGCYRALCMYVYVYVFVCVCTQSLEVEVLHRGPRQSDSKGSVPTARFAASAVALPHWKTGPVSTGDAHTHRHRHTQARARLASAVALPHWKTGPVGDTETRTHTHKHACLPQLCVYASACSVHCLKADFFFVCVCMCVCVCHTGSVYHRGCECGGGPVRCGDVGYVRHTHTHTHLCDCKPCVSHNAHRRDKGSVGLF